MAQGGFPGGGGPPGGGGSGQMPAGQMPWMGMPGFMDPSMMQGMMAALQQGQGMQQMPGMQPMQGVPQMQQPQQQMPAMQPTAPMQMPNAQVAGGGPMPGGAAQMTGMGQMQAGQMSVGQMPVGQMPWMGQMTGFIDPQMMQNMMAAMQQGQGMQPMPGMPGMQPMPGMQAMPTMPMPTAAPQQAASIASAALSSEDAEKVEAIQKCVENLSTVEKEYYTFLWEQSVGDTSDCHQGKLEGKAAFDFLSKSQLPREMLKRIWDMTDWRKRHFLLWEDFVVAMKLISAQQKKQLVSLDRVFSSCSPTSRDCPEFEGIPNAATFKGGTAAVATSESELLGGTPAGLVDTSMVTEAPVVLPPEPTPVAASQPPPLVPSPAPDLMDLMQGMATSFATSQAPVQQPDVTSEIKADPAQTTAETSLPVDEDEWGGFDTALPGPAAPPGNEVPPTSAPETKAANDWNAFEDTSTGGNATTWNAFDSQVEPASSPPVTATTTQDDNDDDDWASFSAAPQAATNVAATAPPTAPGGNLWAKMSAFDDLLREDDVLPTEEAATPAASLFDGTSSTVDAAHQPPGEVSVNSAAETFQSSGDDWGDFETSAAPPVLAMESESTVRPDSADWGDFESSGFSAPTVEASLSAPAATEGGTAGEDLFREGSKVDFEASSTNIAENVTSDWAAFTTAEPSAVLDAAKGPAGDECVSYKDSELPAANMEAFADFGFDDDDVGSSSLPEAKPTFVEPAPFNGEGFQPQWVAFETATEPHPKVEGDDFSAATAETFPDANSQSPPVLQSPQAVNEAFADFGFADDEKVAPLEVPQESFADFGFDDESKAVTESQPESDRVPSPSTLAFDEVEAPGAAITSGIPVVAEDSWGAFGDDDDFQFSSAPPLSQGASISPAVSSAAPVGGTSLQPPPSVTHGLPPASAQQEVVEEEDCGPIDEEHRHLAEGLVALGLFQDAQQCQARGTRVHRLADAETRKKEAAARDDFESAIAMRTEIEALVAEIGDNGQLETWRKLVANGERDVALDAVSERLRERCQYLVDAASRAALSVAVGNFRSTCPASGVGTRLAEIPGLMRRQRRAWQMSRAIEAAGASDVLLVLQILLVCLAALGELFGSCSRSLKILASSDMSQEDRQLIYEASEFKNLLRGVSCLRRLQWRFSLSAELFLPRLGGAVDLGEAGEDAKRLEELHLGASSRLTDAKAAWASVEGQLTGMKLDIGQWEPTEYYEVSAGSCCSAVAAERHRSAPLCVLCLLPAAPLGFEAPADGDAASTLWKKGVWHVQCANFWIRHGARSSILKDLGISDPFGETMAQ